MLGLAVVHLNTLAEATSDSVLVHLARKYSGLNLRLGSQDEETERLVDRHGPFSPAKSFGHAAHISRCLTESRRPLRPSAQAAEHFCLAHHKLRTFPLQNQPGFRRSVEQKLANDAIGMGQRFGLLVTPGARQKGRIQKRLGKPPCSWLETKRQTISTFRSRCEHKP